MLHTFLLGMSLDVATFKVCVVTNDSKFWNGVNEYLVVEILTRILLTLLTFIALPSLRKISICHRWFLLVVSYDVNFQFTPDNSKVSKT